MALISTYVDNWIYVLVFKTTYIDAGKPLWEDAFFFTRRTLFPPLDKRNTRDKAKGLCISSERYVGELGARCLSTMSRGQDSAATVSTTIALQANDYCVRLALDSIALPSCRFDDAWRAVCGSGTILRISRLCLDMGAVRWVGKGTKDRI